MLETDGYELDHHTDASRLLPIGEPFPNVILLDSQLGDAYGSDICRRIKADPDTANIPVIMISGSSGLSDIAQEACADAWLEKPFSIDALKELIRSQLRTASKQTI